MTDKTLHYKRAVISIVRVNFVVRKILLLQYAKLKCLLISHFGNIGFRILHV